MYKRGWGWSQFRVTFLKMDLTYLDFTILVGCVSLPLEAIIRAHLLQSFLFLLEQSLWSVAGLFCYFFLLSLSRRGQYCLQTPLTQNFELWPWIWGLQVQRYWSCGSCHWAESDYYSEKWRGFWLLTCVTFVQRTKRKMFAGHSEMLETSFLPQNVFAIFHFST